MILSSVPEDQLIPRDWLFCLYFGGSGVCCTFPFWDAFLVSAACRTCRILMSVHFRVSSASTVATAVLWVGARTSLWAVCSMCWLVQLRNCSSTACFKRNHVSSVGLAPSSLLSCTGNWRFSTHIGQSQSSSYLQLLYSQLFFPIWLVTKSPWEDKFWAIHLFVTCLPLRWLRPHHHSHQHLETLLTCYSLLIFYFFEI